MCFPVNETMRLLWKSILLTPSLWEQINHDKFVKGTPHFKYLGR